MPRVIKWTMQKMALMIARILMNRFDCFIVIEGNRGLGKSTLAIHLARRVARIFKKMEKKEYKFHWYNSFIYTKKDTKKFWHGWRQTGIADEMINVTFNRDFYNEDQKDIIKMMNMNRDHCNFFISCVPQFQTLDSQIKNLCKIRITVVRRGLCIIQTPNRTIYMKDKWDQATNEKIEREWIRKGIKNPHYTRLTTFRGIMKFPALRPTSEEKYQVTKDRKRNMVAQEEMGLEEEKKKEPLNVIINMLEQGQVKNANFIDGFALANGYKPTSFKRKIRDKLKSEGKNAEIVEYYWDKKLKKEKDYVLDL